MKQTKEHRKELVEELYKLLYQFDDWKSNEIEVLKSAIRTIEMIDESKEVNFTK